MFASPSHFQMPQALKQYKTHSAKGIKEKHSASSLVWVRYLHLPHALLYFRKGMNTSCIQQEAWISARRQPQLTQTLNAGGAPASLEVRSEPSRNHHPQHNEDTQNKMTAFSRIATKSRTQNQDGRPCFLPNAQKNCHTRTHMKYRLYRLLVARVRKRETQQRVANRTSKLRPMSVFLLLSLLLWLRDNEEPTVPPHELLEPHHANLTVAGIVHAKEKKTALARLLLLFRRVERTSQARCAPGDKRAIVVQEMQGYVCGDEECRRESLGQETRTTMLTTVICP